MLFFLRVGKRVLRPRITLLYLFVTRIGPAYATGAKVPGPKIKNSFEQGKARRVTPTGPERVETPPVLVVESFGRSPAITAGGNAVALSPRRVRGSCGYGVLPCFWLGTRGQRPFRANRDSSHFARAPRGRVGRSDKRPATDGSARLAARAALSLTASPAGPSFGRASVKTGCGGGGPSVPCLGFGCSPPFIHPRPLAATHAGSID
ncbi:hypothetical protein D3877_20890 [Azospirillum cavernae]|uniref:Uncharacterized protein n=1 Tax=Azospirillum cavernae TaxID=2320860 RepID=A0A418VS31_9PROT|nr:hypothetical protein D3877_20890 [Azospirillum cavernae]